MFSVVIPAFNQGKWLARAIESALRQEELSYELIVVNDGSTDETAEILKGFRGRIRVIEQRNHGLSYTRNRGACEAAGEYIVYLDSDDLLFPWSLRLLREIIENNQRPALALSRGVVFRDESELCGITSGAPVVDRWRDFLESVPASYWIGVSGAIQRKVLLQYGGFQTAAEGAEDHDFWLRIGAAAGFVYLKSPPVYAYRQQNSSITHQGRIVSKGVRKLLERERRGLYPGGAERALTRRLYLARLVAWGVRRCFFAGDIRAGYRLYGEGLWVLLEVGASKNLFRLPVLPLIQMTAYLARRLRVI